MKFASLLFASLAAAWSVEDGKVAVSGSGDSTERVSFESLLGETVQLPVGKSLDVAFKIPEAPPRPHQAMLRIYSDEYGSEIGQERLYQAKLRGGNAKVVLPHRSVPWELRETLLHASIVVASYDGTPIEVPAFDLVVYGDDHSNAAKARQATQPDPLKPRPVIVNQFQPSPCTVNPVFALAAAGAIVVSFLLLLQAWSQSGVLSNLKFPQSTAQLVFATTIVGFELVFLAYFIHVSIFTAITAGAVLFPIALWSGKRL